jgi:uncharacterized protein (TIGR02145 family)
MKKVIYSILSLTMLTACKKESSSLTTNNNNTTDTNKTVVYEGKYGNGVTDIDGNKYKTTIIGTQEWMAENLKVTKYNDGTTIPNVTDSAQWSKLNSGAWCNYKNNDSLGNIYGKLYNWYTANKVSNGNKNVCPNGWHVPTDIEWTILTNYLGGLSVAGGKMKEEGIVNWRTPNTGAINTSLFTLLPAGDRNGAGEFLDLTNNGLIWSSSEYKDVSGWTAGWLLYAKYSGNNIEKLSFTKRNGSSIRCIKD